MLPWKAHPHSEFLRTCAISPTLGRNSAASAAPTPRFRRRRIGIATATPTCLTTTRCRKAISNAFSHARARRYRLGAPYDSHWIDDAWKNYWDGIYGICLTSATPENIVRKNVLIDRIQAMLEDAETCAQRRIALLRAVDELDALERPFCDFDRRYFGRPVSRDVYIEAVRRRYVTKVARNSPRAELPT